MEIQGTELLFQNFACPVAPPTLYEDIELFGGGEIERGESDEHPEELAHFSFFLPRISQSTQNSNLFKPRASLMAVATLIMFLCVFLCVFCVSVHAFPIFPVKNPVSCTTKLEEVGMAGSGQGQSPRALRSGQTLGSRHLLN